MNKPKGFEQYLGEYKECFYDGYCGEVIAWGFPVIARIEDSEKWAELGTHGKLECSHGSYPASWYLITKVLGVEEAIEKYGQIKKIETGPRGGFKHVIIGDKTFSSKLFADNLFKWPLIDSVKTEII